MRRHKGEGTITKKGYLTIWHSGKMRTKHRIEWENHFGEIPTGMHIHHKDGDKLNNHISNLQLVNPLEHGRLRSSYRLVSDGVWDKQCKGCKEWLPLDAYSAYQNKRYKNTFIFYKCKKCVSKKKL